MKKIDYIIKSYGLGVWSLENISGNEPSKAMESIGQTITDSMAFEGVMILITETGHYPLKQEAFMANSDFDLISLMNEVNKSGSDRMKFRLSEWIQHITSLLKSESEM